MIVTEFLPISQFDQYGDWLKSQDAETQEMYFGISGSEHVIDTLMDQIRRPMIILEECREASTGCFWR